MATIGGMSLDELKALIDQRIQERLIMLFGDFEIEEAELFTEEPDIRSIEEVFESIDKHIWTPPPGAKSSQELLREDRENK